MPVLGRLWWEGVCLAGVVLLYVRPAFIHYLSSFSLLISNNINHPPSAIGGSPRRKRWKEKGTLASARF